MGVYDQVFYKIERELKREISAGAVRDVRGCAEDHQRIPVEGYAG